MFYNQNFDDCLRFGDVLSGVVSIIPSLKSFSCINEKTRSYNLEINVPNFCVVLTPCCSIEDKMISFAPLIPVLDTFAKRPGLVNDFTKINKKIKKEETMTSKEWEKKTEEEKSEILAFEPVYAWTELFVYDGCDCFPEYVIGNSVTTKCYMISFKHIYTVKCNEIIRSESVNLKKYKVKQLSIETRDVLRNKLLAFYARKPAEDEIMDMVLDL